MFHRLLFLKEGIDMLELATMQDMEKVNALAQQVHAMHVAWRPDIYKMEDVLYPAERMQEVIRQRQLYVAKIQREVVGYVFLEMKNKDRPGLVKRKVMVIHEVCVEKELQNRGIGKAMMEDVHALAKAFRCTDMQLGVYPQNDAAVAFYQK